MNVSEIRARALEREERYGFEARPVVELCDELQRVSEIVMDLNTQFDQRCLAAWKAGFRTGRGAVALPVGVVVLVVLDLLLHVLRLGGYLP